MTIHELRNECEQANLKMHEISHQTYVLEQKSKALWKTIEEAEAGNIYRTQEDIDEMYNQYEDMIRELSELNDLLDAFGEKIDALETLIGLKQAFNI